MVVFSLVEGIDLFELVTHRCHVVGYYIHHYIHVPFVDFFDEFLQLFFCAEVIVYFFKIPEPVAMISSLEVVDDRRHPESIESKFLDVV